MGQSSLLPRQPRSSFLFKLLILVLLCLVPAQYFLGTPNSSFVFTDFTLNISFPRFKDDFWSNWTLKYGGGSSGSLSSSEVDQTNSNKFVLTSFTSFLPVLENGSTTQWATAETTTDKKLATTQSLCVETSSAIAVQQQLPLCPVVSPNLTGRIQVNLTVPVSESEFENWFPELAIGGQGKPSDCTARHRLAIVIPYRDRYQHLLVFLQHMLKFFRTQQLEHRVFVVEQVANQTFNRGKLMNIGYVEGRKLFPDATCFAFHDVDLLPEDNRNLYTCPDQPRHLSASIDKHGYKLPYTGIFGGAVILTNAQFEKGWGGEDDDLSGRVQQNGYRLARYSQEIARYKMIKHRRDDLNPTNKCRFNILYSYKKRWKFDGLNSLRYKLLQTNMHKSYTKFTVDLLETDEQRRLKEAKLC